MKLPETPEVRRLRELLRRQLADLDRLDQLTEQETDVGPLLSAERPEDEPPPFPNMARS